METIEFLIVWARTIGVGGAFFIIALLTFGICALALWVALTALKRVNS